jgi:hypothetical protein
MGLEKHTDRNGVIPKLANSLATGNTDDWRVGVLSAFWLPPPQAFTFVRTIALMPTEARMRA